MIYLSKWEHLKYRLQKLFFYSVIFKPFHLFTFFVCSFLFLVTVSKVSAQDNHRQILSETNQANFYGKKIVAAYPVLSSHFNKYEVVKIPTAAIAAFLTKHSHAPINIGLQINDETGFNLQLEQNDLLANDYTLTTQAPKNKITTYTHPFFFYKGIVKDSAGGTVRLCIREGYIYGYIKNNGREYFIDPLNRYDTRLPADEFIFYEAKDVVNSSVSCGFNDVQNTMKDIKHNEPGILRPVSPGATLGTICKEVKFLIATDYSMYKSFNRDLNALQTFLLANINMAEGLFTTLNLDSTLAGDLGNDPLHFKVTQIHTSICDSCDFMSSADITTGQMALSFSKWLDENTAPKQAFIYQYWTTWKLGIAIDYLGFANPYKNYPGCFTSNLNFIKYFTQDLITVRLQISHEAGHAFGCPHDNDISPSVTGFIMNAYGTYSPDGRFSRLSDFGGINYSSQQTINKTILQSACFDNCSPAVCGTISDLKTTYFNSSDSIKISWIGSGNYFVKYKIKDSLFYNAANQFTVAGNEIILKQIASCTNYTVQVQPLCAGNIFGTIESINFNSSPFEVVINPVNLRGDVYDLNLLLECKNCDAKDVIINVDHKPYDFQISKFPFTVTIPDLFADGARHRVDYNGDRIHNGCTIVRFYKAPYYRENSIKIINENFDSCYISGEWKDTALKTIPPYRARTWGVAKYAGDSNVIHGWHYKGNFDSTCMLYDDYGTGISTLISQPHDLTPFTDIYLSFDYRYLSYVYIDNVSFINSSFKVQVYNGRDWLDVFSQDKLIPFVSSRPKLIWDTIPARVFIKLDKYNIGNFKVRFYLDDGFTINPNTGNTFLRAIQLLYLDNIKIDAYNKVNQAAGYSFSIYPNPAKNDIFINLNPVTTDGVQYKITDVLGRVLRQQNLTNFRINVSELTNGIYFLALYKDNKQIGKTVKFFK